MNTVIYYAKKTMSWIIFLGGIFLCIFLSVKWAQNPSLTQMEFFQENLWSSVAASVSISFGLFLNK